MKTIIRFDDNVFYNISRYAESSGMKDHKEFINNGVNLLMWAIDQARDGRVILSVGDGADRELSATFLDNMKP